MEEHNKRKRATRHGSDNLTNTTYVYLGQLMDKEAGQRHKASDSAQAKVYHLQVGPTRSIEDGPCTCGPILLYIRLSESTYARFLRRFCLLCTVFDALVKPVSTGPTPQHPKIPLHSPLKFRSCLFPLSIILYLRTTYIHYNTDPLSLSNSTRRLTLKILLKLRQLFSVIFIFVDIEKSLIDFLIFIH